MVTPIFSAYVLGIATGFVGALAWGLVVADREKKNLVKRLNKAAEQLKQEVLVASAKKRFAEAVKITEQQQELISRLDGPSKGALFSQWRNDVRGELLNMERQKMDIMRSIVADGIDPMVSVTGDNGELLKKKMSESIAEFDAMYPSEHPKLAPKQEPTAAVEPIKPAESKKTETVKITDANGRIVKFDATKKKKPKK